MRFIVMRISSSVWERSCVYASDRWNERNAAASVPTTTVSSESVTMSSMSDVPRSRAASSAALVLGERNGVRRIGLVPRAVVRHDVEADAVEVLLVGVVVGKRRRRVDRGPRRAV